MYPTLQTASMQRIRARIMDRQPADIQAFLDQALATRSADAIVSDVLLPAMRAVVAQHLAGEVILPDVLASAEIMQRADESTCGHL